MKKETKYLIKEVTEEKYFKELHAKNTIEFDKYFKYSGKEERRIRKYKYGDVNYSQIVTSPTEYVESETYKLIRIHNDMSNYILKKTQPTIKNDMSKYILKKYK
jgi:hypothetical protein